MSPSSFPIAIGVLDWLIHYINCSNGDELEEVSIDKLAYKFAYCKQLLQIDERTQILANAFKGKLAGRIDVVEDVEKIYAE